MDTLKPRPKPFTHRCILYFITATSASTFLHTNRHHVPFLLRRSHQTPGADNGSLQVQHKVKDQAAAGRHSGHAASSERDEEKSRVPHHLRLQSSHGSTDS